MSSFLKDTQIKPVDKNHCALALGCWAFGNSDWGGQNDEDSLEAMKTAWDMGITHWDTALGYGSGHSESLCGKFLKGKWDQVFLATKGTPGKKAESIIKSLDKSLNNLGTDYIDLYYLHWPRSDVDMRPYLELLERRREMGSIGAIGVSNFSLEQMKQVNEAGKIDAHQLCYNLYWRKAEADIIPYCMENEIAVISYSSIAQGTLTGKFSHKPVFNANDYRSHSVFFQSDVWPTLYDATEKLKLIAADIDCPLHHLAIQWVMQQTVINSVIVGARNGRQVQDNVASLNRSIPEEIMIKITEISNEVITHLPNEDNVFKHYP